MTANSSVRRSTRTDFLAKPLLYKLTIPTYIRFTKKENPPGMDVAAESGAVEKLKCQTEWLPLASELSSSM